VATPLNGLSANLGRRGTGSESGATPSALNNSRAREPGAGSRGPAGRARYAPLTLRILGGAILFGEGETFHRLREGAAFVGRVGSPSLTLRVRFTTALTLRVWFAVTMVGGRPALGADVFCGIACRGSGCGRWLGGRGPGFGEGVCRGSDAEDTAAGGDELPPPPSLRAVPAWKMTVSSVLAASSRPVISTPFLTWFIGFPAVAFGGQDDADGGKRGPIRG